MRDGADVIVIGAGISGLTVAYGLKKRGRAVTVLEAEPRAGGVIGTRHRDDVLYELGPNSTFDTTPCIGELLRELRIAGERVAANPVAATRFVVRGGKPIALPASPSSVLHDSAFTVRAKLRLLGEPFVAPSPPGVEESIATFVRRRLGVEFLDYAIDPFVAGVYAGDPGQMSVAAAFPRLHALEQQYGSPIRGQLLGARKRRLNREVGAKCRDQLLVSRRHANAHGCACRRTGGDRAPRDGAPGYARCRRAFVVEGLRRGEALVLRARTVVLYAPAGATAAMIDDVAAGAAAALAGIEYAPITIVAGAYLRGDVAHSLAGFGFLVPTKERRRILGCLFSSSMFDGRAPAGTVLVTAFAGVRRNPEVASLPDAPVANVARDELADIVGAGQRPLWQEVVRWSQAIPQYDLGHLARLRRIAAAEAAVPGLYFCASYRGGVAAGDRVKCGDRMASQVDAFLRA